MNPLTLRQSFQTANLEALRAAQTVNEVLARETAQKKGLDDRMDQESKDVAEIPKADAMRTEERKSRQQEQSQEGREAAGEDKGEAEATGSEGPSGANFAAKHLDFLI